MDIDKLKIDVVGRWHGICNALGIEVGNGKHGPCPMCGGKDRFRFDDKGDGLYFCNQCGPGDGWKLVQNILKIDFLSACEQVAQVIGHCDKINFPTEPKVSKELMRKIFIGSVPAGEDNLVGRYLKNRGLKKCPNTLRYAEKCWNAELKQELPAMLAVFTLPDGEAVTMHRTYLSSTGDKAPVEKVKMIIPSLKPMSGGAVRLFPVTDHVGIAEGIETAIAVSEHVNIPCWAATTAVLLEKFIPPAGIEHVSIFGDNDKNFTGHAASYRLANRLSVSGVSVDVHIPVKPGDDWLDVHVKRSQSV